MKSKPYGYVYKIVCKINDKLYVGQTIRTISERWRGHKYKATRPSKEHDMAITRAMHKYGPENFEISAVCRANNEKELNEREKFIIRIFDSINNGYNIHEGGLNQKISEETKKKMSAAGKGKKKPPGFGEKMRQIRLGTKQPESVKIKCSLSQRGEKSAWFGKKHTQETKIKMSNWQKGKSRSDEQKENQRIAMTGRKASEETKKKMSAAGKGKKRCQKSIKCLETGTIYPSIKEASESLNINLNSLRNYLKIKRKGNKEYKCIKGFCFEYVK